MNRRNILTVIVVLSSCILSFGGFFIMQELLIQKEQMILSQTDTFPLIVADRPESDDIPPKELSQEELWQVLRCMESTASEELHEPFGRQISMKEAIENGKVWMKEFYGNFIDIEDEQYERYEKITATLHEKHPVMDDNVLSDELYSYWKVKYVTEDIEIDLLLNSVTGQVLQAKIRLMDLNTSNINIEELLRAYGETFSLKPESGVRKNHELNYLRMENEIYVIFSETNFEISEQKETVKLKRNGTVWNLYLSTELRPL